MDKPTAPTEACHARQPRRLDLTPMEIYEVPWGRPGTVRVVGQGPCPWCGKLMWATAGESGFCPFSVLTPDGKSEPCAGPVFPIALVNAQKVA